MCGGVDGTVSKIDRRIKVQLMTLKINFNSDQCYNCSSAASTLEHVIPGFLLLKDEEGYLAPCCKDCQTNLNWLDSYAALYFMFHEINNDVEIWKKWFRESIFHNGSTFSLRYFGDDVVTDEGILLSWIHKVCVGVSYKLFGKLDNNESLYITTNFSRLGEFCIYNSHDSESYSEDMTEKVIIARDMLHGEYKKVLDIYGITKYHTKNVKIVYAGNRLVHGAYWFRIMIKNNFSIICAVAHTNQLTSRNMIIMKLPIRIVVKNIINQKSMTKINERGESIASFLSECPTSYYSKRMRSIELRNAGISAENIEVFENSLADYMDNKGGKELLKNKFIKKARDIRGKIEL